MTGVQTCALPISQAKKKIKIIGDEGYHTFGMAGIAGSLAAGAALTPEVIGTAGAVVGGETLLEVAAGTAAVAGAGYLAKKLLNKATGGKNMGVYDQIDAILGGVLPGGVAASDYTLGGHYVGKRKKRHVIDVTSLNNAMRRLRKFDNVKKRVTKTLNKLAPRITRRSYSPGIITRREAESALRR